MLTKDLGGLSPFNLRLHRFAMVLWCYGEVGT